MAKHVKLARGKSKIFLTLKTVWTRLTRIVLNTGSLLLYKGIILAKNWRILIV